MARSFRVRIRRSAAYRLLHVFIFVISSLAVLFLTVNIELFLDVLGWSSYLKSIIPELLSLFASAVFIYVCIFCIAFCLGMLFELFISSALGTNRRSNQLALQSTFSPQLFPYSWTIRWSPKTFLRMEMSEDKFAELTYDRDLNLYFYLTNLGPGRLRNIRISWHVPKIDLLSLREYSPEFDAAIFSDSGTFLDFRTPSGSFIMQYSNVSISDVLFIDEAETQKIIVPVAIQDAFMLHLLDVASHLPSLGAITSLESYSAFFADENTRPYTLGMEIIANYIDDSERSCSERFRLWGRISGISLAMPPGGLKSPGDTLLPNSLSAEYRFHHISRDD